MKIKTLLIAGASVLAMTSAAAAQSETITLNTTVSFTVATLGSINATPVKEPSFGAFTVSGTGNANSFTATLAPDTNEDDGLGTVTFSGSDCTIIGPSSQQELGEIELTMNPGSKATFDLGQAVEAQNPVQAAAAMRLSLTDNGTLTAGSTSETVSAYFGAQLMILDVGTVGIVPCHALAATGEVTFQPQVTVTLSAQ